MSLSASGQGDVVVIGSGIGGLTAAILLLKLGYQVTVVEKNRHPGGLMRNYTRRGISCPVGVHYVGSLGIGQPLRRMFDYLGVSSLIPLARMGREGIVDQYIFKDFIFNVPEGLDAYEENLRQAFPGDQRQITALMANLRDIACRMEALEVLYASGYDFFMKEAFFASLGKAMSALDCSPGLRSVLAMNCSWIGVPLDECPVYYHHMALASYLLSSWRCNGAAMTDAFTGRIEALGGVLVTGDPVEKILVRAGAADGVVLKSGTDIHAARVVSTIHPKMLLPMLPEGSVRPAYRERICNLRDTHGVFGAHYVVNAQTHPEVFHNIYEVAADAQGRIDDVTFYQLRSSGQKGRNLLSIATSIDPEAWQAWEKTRTGHRGEDYLAAKEKKAGELIGSAEATFGTFQDLELLDAYTHLTIRDWVNSPGGSAYGVMRSTGQLTSAAMLNRTSIQGLFMAGQSVLAPGIFGTTLGSFHTVRQMIGVERFVREVQLS